MNRLMIAGPKLTGLIIFTLTTLPEGSSMSGRLVVMVEVGIFSSDQANMTVPFLYETVQSTNCGTLAALGRYRPYFDIGISRSG